MARAFLVALFADRAVLGVAAAVISGDLAVASEDRQHPRLR
jgi:hypothetical protein